MSPAPRLAFNRRELAGAFGDIGMSITVRGRVRAGEQWAVTGELRRRVLAAFATAGINLPSRSTIVIQRNGE